jgi:hypothetical protein
MEKKKAKISIKTLGMFMFIVAIGAYSANAVVNMGMDTDTLWHFKLGEEIFKTHRISLENTMTFLEGTEWIPQEWLFEVILYAILSLTGYIGYLTLEGVNLICTTVLAERFNKKANVNYNRYLFMIATIFAFNLMARNRGNRPSEFSVYFIVLLVWLYNSNVKYKKLWYALLGVFIANFHGGTIIIMMALLIIMFIIDLAMDIYEKKKPDQFYYWNKMWDMLIFLVATFINPAGPNLVITSLKISSLTSTSYITEWKPMECTYIQAIYIAVILISFGYQLHKKVDRQTVQTVAVLSALLILSLTSVKAILIFDMMCLCYGFKYLDTMVNELLICKLGSKLKKISLWFIDVLIPAAATLFIMQYILSVSAIIAADTNDLTYQFNRKVSSSILEEIKENYTDDTKILTEYVYGNYILFNDMKCFVDTRQWPYAKELGGSCAIDELFYVELHAWDSEAVKQLLDKYEFDYIWTCSSMPLDSYLETDDDYELVMTVDILEEDESEDDKTDKDTDSNTDKNEESNEIYNRSNSTIESLWIRVSDTN